MSRHSRFPAVNRDGRAPKSETKAAPKVSVPDGNVGEIVAWAGDDPARRAAAVAAENERDTPRKGVLALG